jgi:hypothetical protein
MVDAPFIFSASGEERIGASRALGKRGLPFFEPLRAIFFSTPNVRRGNLNIVAWRGHSTPAVLRTSNGWDIDLKRAELHNETFSLVLSTLEACPG